MRILIVMENTSCELFIYSTMDTHIYSVHTKYIWNLEPSWICLYLIDKIFEDDKIECKVTNYFLVFFLSFAQINS